MGDLAKQFEQGMSDIGIINSPLEHAIGGANYKSPKERQKARDIADMGRAENAKLAARKAIVPIADPDSGKHGKRRASAKRRGKSGRMSTILSNTETLG